MSIGAEVARARYDGRRDPVPPDAVVIDGRPDRSDPSFGVTRATRDAHGRLGCVVEGHGA